MKPERNEEKTRYGYGMGVALPALWGGIFSWDFFCKLALEGQPGIAVG